MKSWMVELGFSLPSSYEMVQPPKPPNDGGSISTTKLLFKDKVLGDKHRPWDVRNLITKREWWSLSMKEEIICFLSLLLNQRCLISYTSQRRSVLWWNYFGRNWAFFNIVRENLQSIWKLEDDFELINVVKGNFVVSLDVEANREKVINEEPWMV